MKTPRSADDPTSAAAFFHGLPVSVWTIPASSRSFARSSAAARPRISPRRDVGGRSARHARDDAVVNRRSLLERLAARRGDGGVVYPVKNGVGIQARYE